MSRLSRIKQPRFLNPRQWVPLLVVVAMLFTSSVSGIGAAPLSAPPTPLPPDASPEEAQMLEDVEHNYQADYLDLATGDPLAVPAHRVEEAAQAGAAVATHATYAWPFNISLTMGHAIQSYQNYSSGTSSAYFHHGIDMMVPNGTDVFTRSGGQIVNVENYQPGNDLYWEVAVKDPEGYIWQYHHIDKNTIPQSIKDKFAQYQANPTSGGFVAANTYIGDVVYWTVVSYNKRFNHIHLNILAAGGAYVDPMEFHSPLNDTSAPLIQAIGLLKNNAVQSGTTITPPYGLYVRSKDLMLDDVYYLPPYRVAFSIDGGPVTTVWQFQNLPGGASDTAYVNDYYVAPPTCGNYSCRDFYVDLGFTTSGQRTFTNLNGAHTLNVTAYDYYGNSTFGSFTYTVTGGVSNTPPVANPQSVTTAEDTAKAITLTGSDAEGNPLTYSVASSPQHGTLSGTAPNLTYTPAANYNGADSFTFKVNDGTSSSSAATVSITVTAVNDRPVANGQSVTTPEDAATAITLTGSDVDGDPLSYTVVSGPSNGSLSGTGANLSYTPAANYSGTDSFTFKVNDGTVDSGAATISITVTPVNDAPVANPQSASTAEDTPATITLAGSDVEGTALTFTVQSGPFHGVLSGDPPNLTYTPAADYNGADSFSFVVNDGSVNSAPATVDLVVGPINDAPVATPQSVVAQQDVPVSITLLGSDVDGDPLTFGVQAGPSHGQLTGSSPTWLYTPDTGYTGEDSFTFVANDGQVDSAPTAVDITVTRTNHQPTADAQALATDEDTPLAIVLTAADGDNDPLTFAVTSGPTHGALTGDAPNLTYTPDADYNGADSFSFVANDGLVDSTPATVTIDVAAANDAPVATAQSVTNAEDAPVAITLAASDVDGDALTYTVVDGPVNGALSGDVPNLTYTPAPNYNGPDSFSFKVSDGALESGPAVVDITVGAVNDQPSVESQSVTTDEDTAVAITLAGSDIDGDALAFAVASAPAHGSLTGSAPYLTYTPSANYNGADSFTFTASDGQANSEPAAVSISVVPANDAPVANAQSASTEEDTAAAITLTGSDLDGDQLAYSIVTQPANGTLGGAAPNLTYTPASGFSGADSFTFIVNDGQVDSSPATVGITVNPASPLLYLGSSTSGTAGGVSFADEDILIKDVATGAWSLYIDGSDIGLANTDIDAFELRADGSLLMSFDTDFSLSGFGTVDDSDIVRFVPTSTGTTTAGSWSWYFDGSDVGLTTTSEDVDALALLSDGRLVISTLDSVSVTAASGADEDLLVFTPSQLGATTSGTWAMYFDGSDVGLSSTSNEDVNGVWIDAAGKIFLTTLGSFSVTGLSGDGSDIFACTPSSLGSTTACTWSMYWDGSANGFSGEDTDSVSVVE